MKILDVRTKSEYEQGHIKGAEHFNIMDIMNGKLPEISKDTKMYVYCESGNRSMMSKSFLERAGFTCVIDGGGIDSFAKEHNFEII